MTSKANWLTLAVLPLITLAGCGQHPQPIPVAPVKPLSAKLPAPPALLAAPVECPSWMKMMCVSAPMQPSKP